MSKTLTNEGDDRWRRKAHYHALKSKTPMVCPTCAGRGIVKLREFNADSWYDDLCPTCNGTGEI